MKTVNQIKAQVRRCHTLADELNYDWEESSVMIYNALDSVCMKQYGYHAHSAELSRYLKKHPELY